MNELKKKIKKMEEKIKKSQINIKLLEDKPSPISELQIDYIYKNKSEIDEVKKMIKEQDSY